MLATALVVLAPSIMPGWALSSVLDGSGDRFRKALLAPALGLLLMFGVSGLLVVLDLWSPVLLGVLLIGLNIVAYRLIHQRHEEVAKRTRWQQPEAAMHGEVAEETTAPSLSEEAEIQHSFNAIVVNRALRLEHGGRCVCPPVAVAPIAPVWGDRSGLQC